MDNGIVKVFNDSFLLTKIRKNSYRNITEENNPELIRLNAYNQVRVWKESEWNQEYYIIYNSYILEDNDC